jgi:polygalacturonase
MQRTPAIFVGVALLGASACGLASGASAAATGDPRNITAAPAVPAVCTTLPPQGASPRAETVGTQLDTARIQAALGRCGAGHAVRLSGGAFLSGPLTLPSGVSLIVGDGATLYASRQAGVYDDALKPGVAHCGQYDHAGKSCRPLISLARNGGGGGVYGPGVIDGQGGQSIIYPTGWGAPPLCSSSAMPPGFPSNTMSWWDLANCVDVVNIRKLSDTTMNQSNPVLVRAFGGHDLTFSGVTLQNAPKSHLQTPESSNVTIWGIKINTPSDFDSYGMARAHNTDGIDFINSSNVTIAYSYINAGDDHIAIAAKAGSLHGPSSNITIAHDHLYGGHGVSIGSLTSGGVRNVLAEDIVVDGGPNMAALTGIHIKSNGENGGTVENVTYRRFCVRNARYPIWIETTYQHKPGNSNIIYRNIYIDDLSVFNQVPGSGRIVIDGSGATAPIQLTLQDVLIDNPQEANASVSRNASINLIGRQSFVPKGSSVAVAPGAYQMDERTKPGPACQGPLSQPPPFAISRQQRTKTVN